MQYITLDELQNRLKTVCTRVADEREPCALIFAEQTSAVGVGQDDYLETLYLSSNPANAERLREGIRQYRAGRRKGIAIAPDLD
jgi:PHD/YefM family antitoxin component YafN of YafNO toxin-antitoxin module